MHTDTGPTGSPYPAHWSPAAVDAVEETLTARDDVAGADLAALTQVAELITAADALDAVARAAGYTATGSTGQPTVHPAATEARLSRTAAASILARLTAPTPAAPGTRRLTASERGRIAARARWNGASR